MQTILSEEKIDEKLIFVEAIAQGLIDIKKGKIMDLDEAKRRLGIV